MFKLLTPSRLTSPEVECLQSMVGWMICDFTFFLTVFVISGRWEVDMKLLVKGCLQWNPVNY